MGTIHWVVFMLGFSMVVLGLRFAQNFLINEEKKKSIHEMALKWKAKMEKGEYMRFNAISHNHEKEVQAIQLKKVA